MRCFLFVISFLTFLGCQKKIDVAAEADVLNGDVVESNNGIYVEPCHSTTFVTNYPIQAGKVPPFKFTKTHYASGRVKTINMLSRAHPIHSVYKPQAWEVIGAFTYNLKNEAYFVGTKQLWEYYKTPTGAAAKRSIVKKNMKLRFAFLAERNYAAGAGSCNIVYNELANNDIVLWISPLYAECVVGESSDEPAMTWYSSNEDNFGLQNFQTNVDPRSPDYYKLKKKINIVYEGTSSTKRMSYQPTQNWISLEFSLLEVMGWLPTNLFPNGIRRSVAVEFYPYANSTRVVQSQLYRNHKYDAKGNLISYTYADNVLQKTTWLCK